MIAAAPVAVIAGGLSFEREVSLRSGRRIAEALREKEYWVAELDADDHLIESISKNQFTAAFLALHGRLGEDGTVPALLELVGLPYTGSDFNASRLAFDKLASKAALRRAGIAVPEAVPLSEVAVRDLHASVLLDLAVEDVGLPLVVKPNRGGSALGIRLVERPEQLRDALMAAFSYDDMVLLERRILGRELAITIVDGMPPLPIVEIRSKVGWYDYAARYSHGTAEFIAPAHIGEADTRSCLQVARAAHVALGCRDLSRVDAILDSDGTCWVLEVSSSPGFTETSLLPVAIEAAGWTIGDFASHVINRAIGRRPR
jgi:D-alanine-D-alanine ligase